MPAPISCESVYSNLGLPDAAVVIDARREADLSASARLIPGASRGDPDHVAQWVRALPRTRGICVYCSNGIDVSPFVAETLRSLGYPASILEGGLQRWLDSNYVTVKIRDELNVPGGSRWITRERPKIDRLACPWLIRRFIDPDASFFYAPAHRVRIDAAALGAEPYDIADVVFSHRGPRCSFDTFLDEFELRDPVLNAVADIVRAADTGELAQSPQAPGLLAITLGLSANIADDIVLLEQAMTIYDALYAWCKTARNETHSWPKKYT